MTTMIERVARASFAWWAKENEKDLTFEDMPDWEREKALEHARAAIEAMQDYTDYMIVAALYPQNPMEAVEARLLAGYTYKTMITAALSEQDGGEK